MSPRVPETYLEARRNEILEAAFKCFLEKGFHHTTMQDIYKATKLSTGAVYNYFPSKEDIVVAALEQVTDWTISSLTSMVSENPDESLVNIIRFWLSAIKQGDIGKGISVQLEFYAEAARNSSIRAAVLRNQATTHETLVELIEQNQRAGLINPDLDPLSIARTIMGMVFGIMIHKSLEPNVNLKAYGQVCEAILNGTFSGPPKKRRRVK
ncbi:MAG TPA: TetR/AcrR family transcriptional regulator [Dehalococcoidia bacterium]|nr:TetR/AcrR family transcriptional regulator [Dehalococcoidia bacterium]